MKNKKVMSALHQVELDTIGRITNLSRRISRKSSSAKSRLEQLNREYFRKVMSVFDEIEDSDGE